MRTPTIQTTSLNEFNWFSDNGIYMPMINDTGRNIFYKAAIDCAAPGKVVCDIGSGSGLLSVLAVRAGATKVYAVEIDQGRAEFIQKMVDQLGYNDVIEVVNDNFLNTNIRADVYVSETIGQQIFNENIIALADHARSQGGVFIPSQFDMWLRVYEHHPIFILSAGRSEAFEFQPDIDIHPEFENSINTAFQQQHPLDTTLYKANTTNNLFQLLPRFKDIKLNVLYTSPVVTVDLNQKVNSNDLTLTVPYSEIPASKEITVVLFWKAKFQDIEMRCENCWWPLPSKIILPRTRKPNTDIVWTYVEDVDDWKVRF